MKKIILSIVSLLLVSSGFAQKKGFDYKFYGQIRGDIFYNSRANVETVDGLFYMYPKDKLPDAKGEDLNASANGSMYAFYTRLGMNVNGPMLGKAKTSAKVELDFRGSGSTLSVVRLRHAYLNLDWGKSSFLVGQTWHPLYGDVAPQILNLNMGAPFQAFGRAPQLRYRYEDGALRLTASVLWQSQYKSAGPKGKSQDYMKDGLVPEMYVGVDYKNNGWLLGAGLEMISLKPRKEAVVDELTYKVDERVTSLSYEAHAKYTSPKWYFAAKSIYGANLTHVSMLGGYGVKSQDPTTGECEYAPSRNTSNWVNIAYGQKWRTALFMGYMKNLGTSEEVSKMIGVGNDIDQIASGTAELTYNIPHWKFGVEYNYTSAWYGDQDKTNGKGKFTDSHSIGNHRIVTSVLFMF